MAQSALTVTPPNPTPPTNFSSIGITPPTSIEPAASLPFTDDGTAGPLTLLAAPWSGVPNEAAGTEVVVTAAGSLVVAPTVAVSVLGNYTATPNASHASSLTGGTAATLTGVSAGGASGSGTTLLTCTGTGFNRSSVVVVGGIPQATNFVSATSLTVTKAPKKLTAGTVPVFVSTQGFNTATQNWTFT